MKKILLWTKIPIQREATAAEFVMDNLYGINSGNMMFTTSVVRALMTADDVRFETVFGNADEVTDACVERYNAECEYFVIPLANSFRISYMDRLKILTDLVRRLKIPCVVLGVGLQATLKQKTDGKYAFDDTVREFMRAVLEKSAKVGLRGAYTAEYLTNLGFAAESDFTVTGCPAMYMWGERFPEIRRMELTPQSRVCINGKLASTKLIHEWMAKNCAALPDYLYIPQRIEEYWMMGYGVPILRKHCKPVPTYMPAGRGNAMIREKRSVGFMSAYAWMDFMRNRDFAYGCNIHGNIAALLAGTPAMVIEKDRRVKELTDFYEIPSITEEDMKSGLDIFTLYDRADYGPMQRNYHDRFAHYVEFLNENGLKHIYSAESTEAPYDRYVRAAGLLPPYYPRRAAEILMDPGSYKTYIKVAAHYCGQLKKKIK